MCDSPYTIYKKHEPIKGKVHYEDIQVSCGKCVVCKTRRVNDWVFRLSLEAERSSSAFFVTLTYKNENLTKTERNLSTLVKKDLQNFIKRLRKLSSNKIKYYAVGEYGTKTKRPHYHLILFNSEIQDINKAWKLNNKEIGIIHYGIVNKNTIAYTAKYMDKESFIGYSINDKREKQFSVMSKGMGENLLTPQMKKYIINNLPLSLRREGKKYIVPRYYIKKILSEEQNEARKAKIEHTIAEKQRRTKEKYNKLHKNVKNPPTFEIWIEEKIRHRNRQFIINQKRTRNVH